MNKAVEKKIASWLDEVRAEGKPLTPALKKMKSRVVRSYGFRRGFVNIVLQKDCSDGRPFCIEVPAKIEKAILLGWTP